MFRFVTSRQTLLKEPQSVLAKMFRLDSPIQPAATLKDGSYFIDRNPKRFETILEYLRDDELADDLSKAELTKLRVEARYFMLENLLSIINGRLDNLDVYRFRYSYFHINNENDIQYDIKVPKSCEPELFYFAVRKSYFEDVPLHAIINFFMCGLTGRFAFTGHYDDSDDPFQPIGAHFVTSPDAIININPPRGSRSINVKEYIEKSRNYLVAEMKRRNNCPVKPGDATPFPEDEWESASNDTDE